MDCRRRPVCQYRCLASDCLLTARNAGAAELTIAAVKHLRLSDFLGCIKFLTASDMSLTIVTV